MRHLLGLSLAFLLSASSAFAHVENGSYTGTAADGSACGFVVTRQWHETGLHHGLNHRVELVTEGMTLLLSHPPLVDVKAGTVRMEHGVLQGTVGIATGGVGVVLRMGEEEGDEGPKSLTILWDDYKDAAASKRVTCDRLSKAGRR